MAQADFQPTWAFISQPPGYPTGPAVGKIQDIWESNYSRLYHRFSPYSNFNENGGLLNWGNQPFYYVYADQNNQFPNSRAGESPIFPLQDSIIDVQRVTKFLVSGAGVTFLATQLLLQTGASFNETRIYNPTSPIVAAGMGLLANAVRPTRFIDISGGIGGIAQSLLGGAGALLAGGSPINPPSGTTGKGALPIQNASTDGKGLLRAQDANKGLANFNSKWTPSQGSTGGFISMVSSLASSLFANFIPATQPGITYKSDEGSYGIMLAGGNPRFSYTGASGTTYNFGQLWVGGSQGQGNIRKKSEYPTLAYRLFVKYSNGVRMDVPISSDSIRDSIPTVGPVGYSVMDSGDTNNPGYRYEDSLGTDQSEDFEASDMMVQYKQYADTSQQFPSKDPEVQKSIDTRIKLTAVLNSINAASGGTYKATADPNSVLLMQDSVKYNYDRLFKTAQKLQSPNNYLYGALKAYRDSGVKMVSNELGGNVNSFGLPTDGNGDTINTLYVVNSDQVNSTDILKVAWRPYKDDLVAFYFYDVVNDKYIPFRATIKNITEAGNASWEEMPFIGRADRVYSYGGFTRNLNFNVKVVISSISELAPTWQRINYMMTSYKPSNYTKALIATSNTYDRFMVPPMFMLTVGDLYRDQPILIQSITMNIPDDAAWETYNEDNVGSGNWSYMANLIKSPNISFGQVPREVELGFTTVLLEKERAVVGGANFGHAPRTEEFMEWNDDTVPNGKDPNKWNANYVVDVINGV